jgi:hypothetical protein
MSSLSRLSELAAAVGQHSTKLSESLAGLEGQVVVDIETLPPDRLIELYVEISRTHQSSLRDGKRIARRVSRAAKGLSA